MPGSREPGPSAPLAFRAVAWPSHSHALTPEARRAPSTDKQQAESVLPTGPWRCRGGQGATGRARKNGCRRPRGLSENPLSGHTRAGRPGAEAAPATPALAPGPRCPQCTLSRHRGICLCCKPSWVFLE